MAKKLPSQERLKALFLYNKDTGSLKRIKCGSESLSLSTNGYIRVWIDTSHFSAARVIFKYVTGEEPYGDMDHIDGARTNNAWHNLRVVTRSENMQNAKRSALNTSGVTGVTFDKVNDKWQAQITVNYKNIKIGRFNSIDDAIAARRDAETKHGFHENHGRVCA